MAVSPGSLAGSDVLARRRSVSFGHDEIAFGCSEHVFQSREVVLQYMIIERFKDRDPLPVYRRFRDRGRLTPDGLNYLSSWVDEQLGCCFQLMEAADATLLDQWIADWQDLIEFEVYPVISSEEAIDRLLPRL